LQPYLLDRLSVLQSEMNEIWEQLFPFQAGNRKWIAVLLQGYAACLVITVALGALMNAAEGERWWRADRGAKIRAYDGSALDECIWFVFTTLHGVGFGEFMPKGTIGHYLAMATISVGMWFQIGMMAIVMLSQLPCTTRPNLCTVVRQIVKASWLSYVVYMLFIVGVGACMGPYVSPAPSGTNQGVRGSGTGIYWLWCVMHRAPFGDIWPDTPIGRWVTGFVTIISYLYPPFTLAVIAVRRPTMAEHKELIEHINMCPGESLGPGYMLPMSTAAVRDVQLNEQV